MNLGFPYKSFLDIHSFGSDLQFGTIWKVSIIRTQNTLHSFAVHCNLCDPKQLRVMRDSKHGNDDLKKYVSK